MTEAERLDAFEHSCHKPYLYPDRLTEALVQYLKGKGGIDLACQEWQEWQAVLKDARPLHMADLHPSASEQDLDALDRRALDLFSVTNMSYAFLRIIGKQPRLRAAFEYMLSRGTTQHQVLDWALSVVYHAVDGGQITLVGQYLLASLPQYADDLLNGLARLNTYPTYFFHASFVKLLLAAQPPALDLAWQVAQQVQQGAGPFNVHAGTSLSSIARALLGADPIRFTPWLRDLAGPSGSLSSNARAGVLLEQDQEQHLDLALEAARTPLSAQRRDRYLSSDVQITGLQALMTHDPVTSWPLLEEAVISPNYPLSSQAIKILARFGFDQTRPTLQRCVVKGKDEAARAVLELLLRQPWEGQAEFVLSVLAHRSKVVRECASRWLAAQGEAMIDGITPFLAHRHADTRLAAVQALAQIGGMPATNLLAARLDAEKERRVRAAMLDVSGVPAARAAFHGTYLPSAEALTAEAEATLGYLPGPTLAWFDVQAAPTLNWINGAEVPPVVLGYLLYHQSRRERKDALDARVRLALTLIAHETAGNLALALYRGWVSNGAAASESWLLPLACALADERLAPRVRRQIERWIYDARRVLALRAVRALALVESETALDELNALDKQGLHGKLKVAIRQALAEALAFGQPV